MGIACHLYAHSGQGWIWIRLNRHLLEASLVTFRTHTQKVSKEGNNNDTHSPPSSAVRDKPKKNKGDTVLDKRNDNEIPVSR